jgi:hypothetical protein
MGMFDGIFESAAAPLAAEAAGTAMGMPPGSMSLVSSLIGGIGSYAGQQSANQANAEQADKQMQFQKESRSTAYQTAVEDMKKAGLNPMLAYQQGGAGNQPGAQAQMHNAIGAGVTSAQQGIDKYQQLLNLTSQQELIHSQIDDTNASAILKRATAITEAYRPGLTQAQTNEILTKAGLNIATTRQTSALSSLYEKGKGPTTDRPYYQDIKTFLRENLKGTKLQDYLPK